MPWMDEILGETKKKPASGNGITPPVNWFDSIAGGQTMSAGPKLPAFVEENPDAMAPSGQQVVGSLPTDDMARVRYFASKRFPDMPVEQAVDQYFYKDDRLAYRSPDGKAYFEEPRFRAPTSAANLQQDAKVILSGTGPAMSMIGGTLGGFAGAPVGPGTAVGGALTGGAAADMARQYLANRMTGEQKPLAERAVQTGLAATEQGAGQVLGNLFVKAMGFLGRTPTYDIPETTAIRDAAKKFGIALTPAEETGNRTLLRRQKVLANSTEGENKFTDFYEGRNEQVRAAVRSVLGDISPQSSPRMASAEGVEGANAALKQSRADLRVKTGPAYKEAIDDNPQRFWSQDAEDLFSRPSMQEAIVAAKKLAAEEGRTIYVPTFENGKRVKDEIVPDWRSWDYMKKALDGIVDENVDKFGKMTQYGRAASQTRDKLLAILDEANPKYKEARTGFGNEVETRTALEKGVVGDISGLEGNDVLRAGNMIFGKGSSPEDVRLARAAFEKAGAVDRWNALARSHLEQVFNEIPDSATGAITNIGGTFRKAVLGNARKREILEAALEHTPHAMSDFMDLAKVLDATGRAMKGESFTAFAQAGQRELEKEGAGMIPGMVETIEIWRTPSRIARYLADLNTSKYAARQADLFTTPEGRETLRELRRLGTGSAGAAIALSHFLTRSGVAAADDALTPDKNGPASAYSRNAMPSTGKGQ